MLPTAIYYPENPYSLRILILTIIRATCVCHLLNLRFRHRAHVAPLGLWCLVAPVFYKHIAPLGLKDLIVLFFIYVIV